MTSALGPASPAVEFGCGSQHCITCGDDGVPMIVVAVDEDRGLALCADEADRRESVEIALVAPVAPGDQLLVHAGTAIATLLGVR
ncbi:MAG: HypC/HybG/HupF family hydrogenase formation chaperone [Actinomycetota bacterium]|nr:HypC/HybG/HupF family hydrogenase formation chaperone [Actinomycetota bacterium]